MKTCIYLSYVGLGANLLHLSYCHEIAKKFGPVTIITICKNLSETLKDDPNIKNVYYLNQYQKKLIHILKLSKILKEFNFDQIFIFYPSLRLYMASKLSGIKKVYIYSIFEKKGLHLIYTAKKFTEKILKIKDCPTETNFILKNEKINLVKNKYNEKIFKIVLGVGSSGPTTKWGSNNYINLIKKLNENGDYYFFILCGQNEKNLSNEITNKIDKNNFLSLSDKKIEDVLPYLVASDMYVGNDSFGSHITSQSGIKSLVILLDSPKAYTDYSINYHRIIPDGFKINNITHGSKIDPNLISVDKVFKKIVNLKN